MLRAREGASGNFLPPLYQKLRRREGRGSLDNASAVQMPTSIDRAQRARESAKEFELTSSLDIASLLAELDPISTDS